MRGSKAFIHSSKKNRTRNSDAEKLDEIQTHLISLGWHVTREPQLSSGNFTTKNHIRNPDLLIKFGKMELILELDGKIHGNLENQTDKTIARNMDYEIDHMNYIIISEEDAKFFKLDLCDLTAYMVSHEFSKHLAKLNGRLMFV